MTKGLSVYIHWEWNSQDFDYAWENREGTPMPIMPVGTTITVEVGEIDFKLRVIEVEAHYFIEPNPQYDPLCIYLLCEVIRIEDQPV